MCRFSRSLIQNFLCRQTMVPDNFEDFEPPSKNFLATPLDLLINSPITIRLYC